MTITDWLQAISSIVAATVSIGALIVSIIGIRQSNSNKKEIDSIRASIKTRKMGGASGTFVNCAAGDNSFGAVSIRQNKEK